MESFADFSASLAKVPNEGWGALAALIGAVGALFRILPQGEARPKGMAFSRLQVETARTRTAELWVPTAARVGELVDELESNPALRPQLEMEELFQGNLHPLAAFDFGRVSKILRMVRTHPKADVDVNAAAAERVANTCRELVGGGNSVLMPLRIHTRLTNLQDFATRARASTTVTSQLRFSTRGSDPLVSGLGVGDVTSPANYMELSLLQRFGWVLKSFPIGILMGLLFYVSFFLSIVSLGYIQLHTIMRRSSVHSPLFLGAMLRQLRALQADMQRLNAG